MNFKLFLTAIGSLLIALFPSNIFSCGPSVDPYDYYVSFFSADNGNAQGYKPFCYTAYSFLYEEQEPVDQSALLSAEWAAYTGTAKASDALNFVNKFSYNDVSNLYYHLEKKLPLNIPDSVRKNTMTDYFFKSKDLEALGYIMYAKQVEPYVGGGEYWEPVTRDEVKMAKLVKSGSQLFAAAKKDFIKLRYTYQVMRLSHYSGQYNDVLTWYQKLADSYPQASELKNMCTALKAGALLRLGQNKEAAYFFSKAFAGGKAKRVSNFLGFRWSVQNDDDAKNIDEASFLQQCKNNKERASMAALFAMHGGTNRINDIKKIYVLNPAAEELEILVTREINKLEERYFTPSLEKEKGGKHFYYSWSDYDNSQIAEPEYKNAGAQVKDMTNLLLDMAKNKQVANPAFMQISAAYCAFMIRDYTKANDYIASAEKMNPSSKIKDQLMLTKLLVSLNQNDKIDAAFEEKILPSVQWLQQKAKKYPEWKKFYRDLTGEVLAGRYHAQKDFYKEALAIGAADKILQPGDSEQWWYQNGIEYLHDKMQSTDVEKLYALMTSGKTNAFEKYLMANNSVSKNNVIDFAGTAYLREYDYKKAIEWFKKAGTAEELTIHTNPFIDITHDRVEPLAEEEKFSITKTAFAEEMLHLQQLAEKDKANAAKHYYKIASGYYNMTYYGHAWQLSQYYRSGVDGYRIAADATGFEKEYYGCFTAEKNFEKAMNASADKNFKARCLFMMAKCAQKQLQRPGYGSSGDWGKYEASVKEYEKKFMANKYFPQLIKEYGSTAFYKEVYNTCSYLKDFVEKKK
jgi:hypothetical protein